MGKSSTSCFKIITCADSGSVDPDDLHHVSPSPPIKVPSDKRGWSFRKKSPKHRMLSNTVITETPSLGNKESQESAAHNFQTTAGTSATEKIVLPWPEEKSHQPIRVESNVAKNIVAEESKSNDDYILEEVVVISTQAAVRGFLAKRSLLKLKKLVKLQAAVRGHLVRRHAVGTLRCIQAIIKMQALVRAHQAQISLERSSKEEKEDKPNDEDNNSSQPKDGTVPTAKPAVTYTSIEKLLSNRFACQLMESKPKNKPMHIKCDSSRQDSPWQWLERWMSVASTDITDSQRPELSTEVKESENADKSLYHEEAESYSEAFDSVYLKYSDRELSATAVDSDKISISDANDVSFEADHLSFSESKDNREQMPGNNEPAKENHLDNYFTPNHVAKSETESGSNSAKCEVNIEQPKPSMKSSERLESEGILSRSTSRKASNPAFIAAQSKFEVLASTPNSGTANSSTCQSSGVDLHIDKVPSGADAVNVTKQLESSEHSVLHYTSLQVGGSDCGTELSVTSTLDSPDRFDIRPIEFYHKAKVSTVRETSIPVMTEIFDIEADDDMHTISVFHSSDPASVKPEKVDCDNGESNGSVKPEKADCDYGDSNGPVKPEKAASDNGNSYESAARVSFGPAEQTPDRNPSDLQIELEPEIADAAAYKSSSEVSPRSHITVPESQGTPSSLASTKAIKVKANSSGSSNKKKSMSAIKKSPSSTIHDSGARDSMEKMSNDPNSGRRRNSFGSVRPDNGDQEQRDISSSNTLPSYMQATQSARAKVSANNSPRSSPDVQDKELYLKKRRSLPGLNGSDHIQRSLSQAQPGGKGTPSPKRKNGRGEYIFFIWILLTTLRSESRSESNQCHHIYRVDTHSFNLLDR